MQIHVRKYFESKYDKEIYPSKKGIAFTAWRDLKNQIPVMDKCIECSENMLREEAGRIKQEFNQRNVRQLPPPDLYNAGANIPFQFQEEEKMPHQQQNYIYDGKPTSYRYGPENHWSNCVIFWYPFPFLWLRSLWYRDRFRSASPSLV